MDELESILAKMLNVKVGDIPNDLFDRCCRVVRFIWKVKPDGCLRSTQVVASIVEQWDRERRETHGL